MKYHVYAMLNGVARYNLIARFACADDAALFCRMVRNQYASIQLWRGALRSCKPTLVVSLSPVSEYRPLEAA